MSNIDGLINDDQTEPQETAKFTPKATAAKKKGLIIAWTFIVVTAVAVSFVVNELESRRLSAVNVSVDDKPTVFNGVPYASMAQVNYTKLQESLPEPIRNIDEVIHGPKLGFLIVIAFGLAGGVGRLLVKWRNGNLDNAHLRVIICDPLLAVFAASIALLMIVIVREVLFESRPWMRFFALATASSIIGFFPHPVLEYFKNKKSFFAGAVE